MPPTRSEPSRPARRPAVARPAPAAQPRRHLTYDIETGPEGPAIGAFFDLDGTLVAGFSAIAFLRDRLVSGRLGVQDLADVVLAGVSFRREGLGFSGLMAAMARALRGTPERELFETGERVFAEQLAAAIFRDARRLVEAHRERGHTLAVVSAATRYQVAPVARELGIEHVLCTRLEVKGGALTGRVLRPLCHAAGKVSAAQRFCEQHGVDLAKSYAYTDGYEDLPLLEAVGRPRPTNPDRALARLARARAWPSRALDHTRPLGPRDALRGGLVAVLAAGFAGLALPAALASRRSRAPLDLCLGGWGRIGSAVGGIELRITGREHLATRPALFLVNRGSSIDPLLVCRLLERGFALLLRAGSLESPLVRAAAALADGLLVEEPGERDRGRDALALLRRGLSLVAAPEQARSPGAELGAFRAAPFRLARQARVPIVPIVIRNAREALPPNALLVRAGAVRIAVQPPIETRGWRARDLARRIESVRELYLRELPES